MCKRRFLGRKACGFEFEKKCSQIIHRVFHTGEQNYFLNALERVFQVLFWSV